MKLSLDQLTAAPMPEALSSPSLSAMTQRQNSAASKAPVPRVLHIVRQLNHGGIECWLRSLLGSWQGPQRPDFHFALEEKDFGRLAPQFEAMGAQLHYCPAPRQSGSIAALRRVLVDYGPFTAIHCHNHRAAPFNLAIGALEGVPIRIAHSHYADFGHRSTRHPLYRAAYALASRTALGLLANERITVSDAATLDLFGQTKAPLHFMPCGIDTRPYVNPGPKVASTRFTLMHVGRLVPDKNHAHLLRVFAALKQMEANSELWLVGDGPLRQSLEALARDLGIHEDVRFFGPRAEIHDLLFMADVFVFPSFNEGLGLAAVEAQAAGLPAVLASHLPKEVELLPSHCRRLSLESPLEEWARLILSLRGFEPLAASVRLQTLRQSPNSIDSNIEILGKLYAH